jgi:hypothetical protein
MQFIFSKVILFVEKAVLQALITLTCHALDDFVDGNDTEWRDSRRGCGKTRIFRLFLRSFRIIGSLCLWL